MYDYKLLEAFTAVIEHKGFEKASQVLNLTQSAVSQRVRQLEEAAGQILLVRSNPPEPTEAGKLLIAHFLKVQLLEKELNNDLTHKESSGFTTIPIALNADSLCTWFFDAVETTVKKKKLLLKLHVDDQDETHRMLKDGEVSACISTRDKAFQSCTCDFIGDMTYKMYCGSELYDKFFCDGATTYALKEVPVIVYNDRDNLHKQMFRQAFGKVPAEYHFMFIPDVNKYVDAVLRGFGIGMMPYIQCAEMEASGILKNAFAPHTVKTPLYWHRWSLGSSSLDALTKAVLSKHMLI